MKDFCSLCLTVKFWPMATWKLKGHIISFLLLKSFHTQLLIRIACGQENLWVCRTSCNRPGKESNLVLWKWQDTVSSLFSSFSSVEVLFQADHILDCRNCSQAPGSPAPAAPDSLAACWVQGRGSRERRAVGQFGPEAVFGEMAGFPTPAHGMQPHRSSQYKLLPGITYCAPVQCKYLFMRAGAQVLTLI